MWPKISVNHDQKHVIWKTVKIELIQFTLMSDVDCGLKTKHSHGAIQESCDTLVETRNST